MSFFTKQEVNELSLLIYIYLYFFYMFFLFRFITREELRQAMTLHGMGDDASIDEVIEDVDTNKVIIRSWILIFIFLFLFFFSKYICWSGLFWLNMGFLCRTGESTMKSLQPWWEETEHKIMLGKVDKLRWKTSCM